MNIIDNEKWHFVSGSLDQMQKQSDRLRKATKGLFIAPESPLLECQSWTEESLIAALSLLIDDNFELISWFVYECDYGRDPKHAGGSGDMRLIDSHDKLRWIIESNFCRN
jgi:hypothetical protein